MRIKKKFSLIAVMAAFCLSIACAAAFISVDTRAFAADTATFEMVEGASVRLAENTGLRFIVKMDKTTAEKFTADNGVELKILISPEYYFDKITDGNYKNLEKKVEITVDKTKIYNGEGKDSEYYFANGVLANVKSQNYKIEFNAVAYYEENGQTVYSKIPSKNERSFYFVTNKAFIKDGASYAKTILSLNAYSWYGEADAPITVANQEEYDSLVSVIKTAQLDLTGKTVARDYDETYHYTFKGLTADESGVKIPEFTAEEHSVQKWNTANASYDQAVCSCGKTLSEKFNKVVTDERQDVILSDDSHAITLGGISAYKAVKSIKYGDIDLGGDISALTVPDEMANAVHGEQTLTVVVTDNYDSDHTVLVPVTIITKSISTFDELKNCVTFKTGYAAEYQKGKYFILANDISVTSYNTGSAQTWTSGFAGVLDGRGCSLIGGTMYAGGLFGVLNGATIKNIKFKNVSVGGTSGGRVLIAHHIRLSTISDVEIYITDKLDMVNQGDKSNSVIARGHVQELKLYNVLIDASGSKLPSIFGSGAFAANVTKAENVTVIADEVECLINYQSQIKSIEGITVITPKKLTNNNDIILKDKDGDKTEFTVNLEEYADYTIKNVKFGANDLQFNGTTVTISDEIKNGTHGANSLTVTATKDSATVILSVPVTIVTESISTFDELINCVTYKSTHNVAEYQKGKYFILANDISVTGAYNSASVNGGNTWYYGFAGTLDGRDCSLIGGRMWGNGLFGSLNGATIKNIKFENLSAGGQNGNRVLIAHYINAATISKVEIYITDKLDMLKQQYLNSVIARGHVKDLTITDVLVDASGSKLPFIFGQGGVTANIKADNVTIKADYVECLLKDATGTITSIGGITVKTPATVA